MRMFSVGALVGLVVGVLVAALVVGVLAATASERAGRPAKTGEVCDVDESLSGLQGWCVQAREREGGLFASDVHQVWVVARQDGADLPRYTYVDVSDYALRGDLRADFADDGITVRLADGMRLFLPADFYALS